MQKIIKRQVVNPVFCIQNVFLSLNKSFVLKELDDCRIRLVDILEVESCCHTDLCELFRIHRFKNNTRVYYLLNDCLNLLFNCSDIECIRVLTCYSHKESFSTVIEFISSLIFICTSTIVVVEEPNLILIFSNEVSILKTYILCLVSKGLITIYWSMAIAYSAEWPKNCWSCCWLFAIWSNCIEGYLTFILNFYILGSHSESYYD